MRYKVDFSTIVKKFLRKHTELKHSFAVKVELLRNGDTKTLDIEHLIGKGKNRFRLRVGKYRFLYQVIDDEILIYFYDADTRGDVYK